MFRVDEETGRAVEIDETDIGAILDSAKELKALEEKREAMGATIQEAADTYMEAIDDRIVTREAEILRIKWHKLIDDRREVDIQIQQVKEEIVTNALGAL